MKNKLEQIEKHITALSANPDFIHHQWFITHHLKIVEQLANELCDLYPEADRNAVMAMVWLHDFGKVVTNKHSVRESETTVMLAESRKLLEALDFSAEFIEKVIADLEIFEQAKTRDLSQENIEIRIASSADGGSHFVGPFLTTHWHENPDQSVDALVKENIRKATYDITRKIVLQEVRDAFADRLAIIREYDPENRRRNYFKN